LLSSSYCIACVLTERTPLPEHASRDSQAQKLCAGFVVRVYFRDADLEKKNITDSDTGFPVAGRHLGNKLKKLVYNCCSLVAKL